MLTVLAWIFFRADSIGHAFNYIGAIFTNQLFSAPYIVEAESGLHILPKMVILLIILFVFIEWTGRESRYAIEKTFINQPKLFRWGLYYFISMIIFLYGGKSQDFIYFQF